MDRWSTKFRSFDIFPKYIEDVKVKTFTGGAVSICAALLIIVLITFEFMVYLSPEVVDRLEVDFSRGDPLPINFDVSFPNIPCPAIEVELTDVANSDTRGLEHHITKTVLLHTGEDWSQQTQYILGSGNMFKGKGEKYCGSCYNALPAATSCCSSCAEVLVEYKKRQWNVKSEDIFEQCLRESSRAQQLFRARLERQEGCRVIGGIKVPKVGGHFKFVISDMLKSKKQPLVKELLNTPSASDIELHRWQNMSHTINSIRFGEEYSGIVDPLKDATKNTLGDTDSASFLYYLKIVPTRYKNKVRGELKDTHQYSVTEYQMMSTLPEQPDVDPAASDRKIGQIVSRKPGEAPKDDVPVPNGAFFFYELSPIRVRVTEKSRSFAHLITQLCAIVGGVFTVAGLVDRFVYAGVQLKNRHKR